MKKKLIQYLVNKMKKSDYSQFSALWDGSRGLYNFYRPLSEISMSAAFKALSDHSLKIISNALDVYNRTATDLPTAGDINKIIYEAEYGKQMDYTPQMIIDIVRAHNTIIGVLCRGNNLVSFDLDNSNDYYLRRRAELVITQELPEVLEKMKYGHFTNNDLELLRKYKVNPMKEVGSQSAKVIAITQQSMRAIDPPKSKENTVPHESGLTPIELFKKQSKISIQRKNK